MGGLFYRSADFGTARLAGSSVLTGSALVGGRRCTGVLGPMGMFTEHCGPAAGRHRHHGR
jgi:hypothetical protein